MLLFYIILSWFLVGFLCCLLLQYYEYKFDKDYYENYYKIGIYIKASIVGYLFVFILTGNIIRHTINNIASNDKYKDFISKPLFKFK